MDKHLYELEQEIKTLELISENCENKRFWFGIDVKNLNKRIQSVQYMIDRLRYNKLKLN